MRALQVVETNRAPELREVPDPTPGPSQVLIKITAVGLCRTDLAVMQHPDAATYLSHPFPMTLGHECAGTIVDVGRDARPLVTIGENVIVYAPWGCGRCKMCADGHENYCLNAASKGINIPGLGRDGGCADYMLVDRARHCIPIGDLDPVSAAPLTDAALTPYHALQHARPKLEDRHAVAVVIGIGGLGHIAVQLIKLLTPATVVAIDNSPEHLTLAREVGADVVAANEHAVEAVHQATHGFGAEVVFDLVTTQETVDLGARLTRVCGEWSLVGVGGGKALVGFRATPYECQVLAPYWGTRGDLYDVVSLAQRGAINVRTEQHDLADGVAAYRRLAEGHVLGRAVLVP